MPSIAEYSSVGSEPVPGLPDLLKTSRTLLNPTPSSFSMTVDAGEYAGYRIAVTGTGFVYYQDEPLLGEFSVIEVFDDADRSFLSYRWTDVNGDPVSSGQEVSVLWQGTHVYLSVDEVLGSDGQEMPAEIRANDLIDLAGGDDSLASSWAPIIRGGDGNDRFSDIGQYGDPLAQIFGDGGDDQFVDVTGEVYGGAGDD
ncbi:hypothetical protein N4R57_12615 [Rhodobacteraceae bacterium D3-12]|nr:hypothetical protein N4R57_12615 [Rhodobacteraceae bacterium D3-12]